MSVFNQQGQHVNNQYNAAGDIHIGTIQNISQLINELQQLKTHVDEQIASGKIDKETGIHAQTEINNAMVHVSQPAAKKSTLISYLNKAQEILKGVTAAEGLVEGIKNVIQAISKLFV